MSIDCFKERLAKHLKVKFDLVVNENRSTMLNLLKKSNDAVRVSVHRMFLDAPDHVVLAIAHYVRGTRRDRGERNLILRGFIQQNLPKFDYSHLIDRNKLVHQGKVYNVKKIYDKVNAEYFDGSLDLKITWYGSPRKSRCKVVFGQYYNSLKLIKIHRILDSTFFPEIFVSFVVYHEMLHSKVKGFVDPRGRFCCHGEEFKRQEKLFKYYYEATDWERRNKKHFFR